MSTNDGDYWDYIFGGTGKGKAIRIPRKRGSKEKHAPTVLFSIVGIAELLELLSRKYLINLKISKDYFEKSINQYKSGKIKQVNELFR